LFALQSYIGKFKNFFVGVKIFFGNF